MARTGNGQAAVLGPNPLRIPVAAAAGNSYNRMVAIVVVVVAVAVAVAVTATAAATTCASPSGTLVDCVAYSDYNLPDAPLPSRAAGHRSKCAAKL